MAMNARRKPKTIFQLDTPFTRVHWPEVSSENQDNICELLVRILAPIGSHRASYAAPSKGKRSKKRKRQETKINHGSAILVEKDAVPPPPPPEISPYLLIGLASITRHLELLASSGTLTKTVESVEVDFLPACRDSSDVPANRSIIESRHLGAIFICRSSQPSVLHAHLPELIVAASLSNPHLPPTRLVQMPQGSENRLSSALGLSRASFVAILENAPHTKPLLKLVRDVVPTIEVPWLEEARKAQHKPVKINHILSTALVGSTTREQGWGSSVVGSNSKSVN